MSRRPADAFSKAISKTSPLMSDALHALEHLDVNSAIKALQIWRKTAPDIVPCVKGLIRSFEFAKPQDTAILTAATLAAESNTNPYHGNRHFLETFFLAALLAKDALLDKRLSKNDIYLLLVAALIHDYKHDGKTNDGKTFRLEEQSYRLAEPALRRAGIAKGGLLMIQSLVLATDFSKDWNDLNAFSPAQSIRHNKVAAYFGAAARKQPHFVEMALMLQDADLSNSLLSYDLAEQSARDLARERRHDYKGDENLFFLERVCERKLWSKSGQKLIQPYMNEVMKAYGLAESTPRPRI